MKKLILASLAASLVLSLAACQDKNAAQPVVSTAPAIEAPVTPAAMIPAVTMDQAIPSDAFKLTMAQSGTPTLVEGGKAVQIELTISNAGTMAISSTGVHPVNIGVQVLPEAGATGEAAAVRDFLHLPFDTIAAGAAGRASINIPAETALAGRTLHVVFVQEGIQWFDGPTYSSLNLGPFDLCGEVFCDLGAATANTAQ
ncbi:hypothetical protein J2X02_000790 [Pseudoxanthomonas japonensis]|uniref:hypothetical protein n=1 Tax=Pseudoxanthomonas japonensis TaxID=69284 RepID=UPI0028615EC9|nr:hypothetical protein [Pseudoxanthomonas japonensis]MDR7067973.1 hypothetical protein [Pseudoxanthomonas japonensis]